MGDRAAAGISEIIGGISLDAPLVDRILAIVHTSFGRPAALSNVSDREPEATLLLLQHLDAVTPDLSLKTRIADERKFVLDQFAKASAKDTRECLLANFSALSGGPTTSERLRLAQVYLILTDPARAADSLPLRRMGDNAADFINVIVSDCALSSADTERVLAMIRGAFARPEAVTENNRVPNRVLILLQRLDDLTQDRTTKASIVQTREYVLAQLSNAHKN
jgi:hypothetical protein